MTIERLCISRLYELMEVVNLNRGRQQAESARLPFARLTRNSSMPEEITDVQARNIVGLWFSRRGKLPCGWGKRNPGFSSPLELEIGRKFRGGRRGVYDPS